MIRSFTPSESITIIFVIICLLEVTNVSDSMAQIDIVPGYAVTTNGDTLKGFIENRSRASDRKFCYFKKSMTEKATKYSPSEIKAFGLQNMEYYEVLTIKDKAGKDVTVFATLLMPGRASLFRFKRDLYVRHDSLGVYKLQYEGKSDYKGKAKVSGILNFAFADCKSKKVAWDSIVLSDDKIAELVKNYNICKHSPTGIKKENNIPRFKGNLGVFAGVNIMTLQVAELAGLVSDIAFKDTKFQNSSSPIYGLSYSVFFPRFNPNLSAYVEVSYFKSNITGHSSGVILGNPVTEDVTLSANYLRTAFGIRLLFPARSFTPFIKAGISSYNDSNFSGSRVQTTIINNAPFTQTLYQWTGGSQKGIWLGAGIQRSLSERVSINFEARVDRANGYEGPPPGYPLNAFHMTFLFGVSF